MPLASRNDSLGFAERTRKNFEYIESARKRNPPEDVHVVTQLAISLLGLVVFPWEREFKKHMEKTKLNSLDWPKWEILKDDRGDCDTLNKLIWHLRNAVAHGEIRFSVDSESRDVDKVIFKFRDRADDDKPWNWSARIGATKLREFCFRFVDDVVNTIG